MPVAGETITLWIPLRDATGAAITTAVNGDFTNTIRHTTPAGVVTTPTLTNWTHVANGLYSATISPAVEGNYAGIVDYAGTPVQPFVVDEPVYADLVAELAGGIITTSVPVATSGDVTLFESDDYSHTDARALNWTTTVEATWPTLTGATIAFVARHTMTGETIAGTGSVITGTGAAKHVRVPLAAADTANKAPGDYEYQLIATISGRVVTLVFDEAELIARIA